MSLELVLAFDFAYKVLVNNKSAGYIILSKKQNMIKHLFLHYLSFEQIKDILIGRLLQDIGKDKIKIRKNRKNNDTYKELGFKDVEGYFLVYS